MDTYNEKIPEKDRGAVCGSNNIQSTFATFFFLHLMYYPRTTLALPPSSNSDPGSHSGPFSSLPTSARAIIFLVIIARRL